MKWKTTMQKCDNPECDTPPQEVVKGGDLPLGLYIISGSEHTPGGGWGIPPTYACCRECLLPAIEATIAVSLEN